MATDPRRTSKWKRLRLVVLERDDHTCQIRGVRCTLKATHVDHVIPLALGGDAYNLDNLRAACAQCNTGRRPYRRPIVGVASVDWH